MADTSSDVGGGLAVSNSPTTAKRTQNLAIVDEIVSAYRSNASIDFSRYTLAKWTTAFNHLFGSGDIEIMAFAVRAMHAAYPDMAWAKKVATAFAEIPAEDPLQPWFRDDPAKDVQVVHRNGSDTAILIFCDARHHLGFPLSGIHRWLAPLGTSIIYLRDFDACAYLKGIRSLGDSREAALTALSNLLASLGVRKVLCCGNSLGVLPAMHYGLDLKAAAVLALAGPVSLSLDHYRNVTSAQFVRSVIEKFPACADLDMRRLYAASDQPPRLCMVYGEKNREDRWHALHMSGLRNVITAGLKDYGGHDVVIELILRRGLRALFERFMLVGGAAASSSLATRSDADA
jgi:hypothetical protein